MRLISTSSSPTLTYQLACSAVAVAVHYCGVVLVEGSVNVSETPVSSTVPGVEGNNKYTSRYDSDYT